MGELHRTGRPSRCPRSRGHGTSEESNREDVAEAGGTAGDRASPERLGFPSQKAITRKLREVTQGRARDAQSQGGVRRGSPKRHLPRRTACAPGDSAHTVMQPAAGRGSHTGRADSRPWSAHKPPTRCSGRTGPGLEEPLPGTAALEWTHDHHGHKRALPEAAEAGLECRGPPTASTGPSQAGGAIVPRK